MTAAMLLLLLQGEEQPRRDPVLEGLGYLVSHQRSDGSWGGPPSGCSCRGRGGIGGDLESTSWAILAFAGAGYVELSRDELSGRNLGHVVGSALEWLISRQDKEGAFDRDHPAANALAALVLTETYGMTAKRQEPAEKAYAWVEKAELREAVGRIRQGMVIQSGMLSEIGQGHGAKLLALAEGLVGEKGDLARWGSLLLKGFALHGKPNKPAVDFDTGDPLQLPVESLNVFASASFILGNQDRWHEWFRGLKEVLVPLQRERVCEAGSWDPDPLGDRVRATAIRCLTLMHYRCYYCRNVFQPKK